MTFLSSFKQLLQSSADHLAQLGTAGAVGTTPASSAPGGYSQLPLLPFLRGGKILRVEMVYACEEYLTWHVPVEIPGVQTTLLKPYLKTEHRDGKCSLKASQYQNVAVKHPLGFYCWKWTHLNFQNTGAVSLWRTISGKEYTATQLSFPPLQAFELFCLTFKAECVTSAWITAIRASNKN